MPYVAKSNYSYHPFLGLDKFPGGVCTNLQFTIDIYNLWLTFYK